ncbi:cardiolipin synthase [Verrucomicrobiaceae bacterium 227]
MKTNRKFRQRVNASYNKLLNRWPRLSTFLGIVKERRRPAKALFYIALHALGLIHSISAITTTRTPQGAVAWALSLNLVPIVAVPAYWVFGGNSMEEYLETRSVGIADLRPIALEKLVNIDAVEPAEYQAHPLLATLGRISSLPVTKHNAPELLTDGKNTYESIFESIKDAKDYVLVQFYIIKSDGAGNDLKDLLVTKAQEGVDVYVLYDDYGCLDLPSSFSTDLQQAGARISSFMNMDGDPNRFQLNYRNHRKLVIVDGITAFVGGHNIGDEYLGKHPTLTPWRDCHLKIEGPVVSCLQVPFIEDWKWATGEIIDGLLWDLKEAKRETTGSSQAVCIASGPADKLETCALYYHAAIHAAQKRIWIATPYFVPDAALVTSLQLAAKRGVEIRILIPGLSDSFLTERSAYSYLEELDLEGIQIYRYQNGFTHQKVLIVDDDFSAIGSANFDNRSLRLNFELTVGVIDEAFQTEVARMLERDFGNSTLFQLQDLEDKSAWFRFTVQVSRLLAPIQ